MATKLSLAEQREFFLKTLFDGVDFENTPDDSPIWLELADKMALAKDLGRTERWKNACEWPRVEAKKSPAHARWAVVQGAVFLNYAR